LTLKKGIGSLKLVPSSGGVFEISVDGHKLHSKAETGEFPDFDALLKKIQARI
jgi:selenoprotein W-related protein